jgi:hypothetical protein
MKNMITVESNFEPDQNWNARLLESGLGTIFQTKERGIFESAKHKIIYLIFRDENYTIVAQNIIKVSERFTDKNRKDKLFNKIPTSRKKLYSWVYGPVIFKKERSKEIFHAFKQFLISEKCAISGWTNILFPGDPQSLSSNYEILSWGTLLIDLSQSKEIVYQNISKHSGRKNIERSIKRGVIVEEINEKSLLEYSNLINEMKNNDMNDKSQFENLLRRWKTYKPMGYSGFLARKDEHVIGGLLFSYVNGHILEAGVARSKIDKLNHYYSQDLIKWKIIEWGIEHGQKFYDLAGFNPNPISEKEQGILRYKEKWGGIPYYFHRITEKPGLFSKLN